MQILGWILGLLAIAYPLGIYFFRDDVPASLFALIVLIGFAIRHGSSGGSKLTSLLLGAVAIVVAMYDQGFLWVPVLINALLLWTFASTLKGEVSMIERFARITNPELPAPALIYCRYVTMVWCVFFVFNGLVSADLAWKGDLLPWSQYTGGIAYVLMGVLFAVEFCVRMILKPKFDRMEAERAAT